MSDDYAGYREEFLDTLTRFQSMWDGYITQMNFEKYLIKVTHENIQAIHYPLIRAWPKGQRI